MIILSCFFGSFTQYNSMLKNFYIKNFKPFKDQPIQFAPITLIYGPNSSGKSSIIQAQNLLKQSYLSQSSKGLFSLRTNGEIIDLGSFEAISHGHKSEYVEFDLNYNLSRSLVDSPVNYTVKLKYNTERLKALSINYTVFAPAERLTNKKGKEVKLEGSYDFDLIENEKGENRWIFKMTKNTLKKHKKNLINFSEIATSYKKMFDAYKKDIGKKQKKKKISKKEGGIFIQQADVIDTLVMSGVSGLPIITMFQNMLNFIFYEETIDPGIRAFRLLLDSICYIGPLRDAPIRIQRTIGSIENVGISGANTAEILHRNQNLTKRINSWFIKLGIDYKIKTYKLQKIELGESFALSLIDKRTKVEVSPVDVGIGIFQLLPIITQALLSKRQILTIEQPELHLHPKLCAELADFVIENSLIQVPKQ